MENQSSGFIGYIFIGVGVLLVILEIAFLIWFLPGNISEINEKITKVQKETGDTLVVEKAVGVLESVNKTEISEDLMTLETALPSEKRVTGFVSALSGLATSSGAGVKQIDIAFGKVSTKSGTLNSKKIEPQFQDTKLSNDVVGVPIIMSVLGTPEQVLELVSKIQEAVPILGIGNMEYTLGDSEKGGILSVLVYSQPGKVFKSSNLAEIAPLTAKEKSIIESISSKTNILQ